MGEISDPLIKICGITSSNDAVTAAKLGADAIGLNFYPASPRYVEIDQAASICRAVNEQVLKVGLFVNADEASVRDVLDKVPLDFLQFHGDESPAYCGNFKRPYWKAFRVKDKAGLAQQVAAFTEATGILLDAWNPGQYGGSGETFDWSVLDGLSFEQSLILAGGLNPLNVADAITQIQPWAVDVSSGVEEAPGVKSAELMKLFIDEVHRVRR